MAAAATANTDFNAVAQTVLCGASDASINALLRIICGEGDWKTWPLGNVKRIHTPITLDMLTEARMMQATAAFVPSVIREIIELYLGVSKASEVAQFDMHNFHPEYNHDAQIFTALCSWYMLFYSMKRTVICDKNQAAESDRKQGNLYFYAFVADCRQVYRIKIDISTLRLAIETVGNNELETNIQWVNIPLLLTTSGQLPNLSGCWVRFNNQSSALTFILKRTASWMSFDFKVELGNRDWRTTASHGRRRFPLDIDGAPTGLSLAKRYKSTTQHEGDDSDSDEEQEEDSGPRITPERRINFACQKEDAQEANISWNHVRHVDAPTHTTGFRSCSGMVFTNHTADDLHSQPSHPPPSFDVVQLKGLHNLEMREAEKVAAWGEPKPTARFQPARTYPTRTTEWQSRDVFNRLRTFEMLVIPRITEDCPLSPKCMLVMAKNWCVKNGGAVQVMISAHETRKRQTKTK